MKRKKKVLLFAIGLAILLIGPFVYLSQFTFFSADDYCRTSSSWESLLPTIGIWYENINGRYSNAFFSHLPIYDLPIYRSVLALSIIFLNAALFFFLRELVKYFDYSLKLEQIYLLTVILNAVLISQLPSVYEFFYWYAATSAYMYSFILFLLLSGLLLRAERTKVPSTLFLSLIIILLVGNNEMLIIITNILLFLLLIKNWIKKSTNYKKYFFLNLISLVSTLVVFKSPGTSSRMGYYPEAGDFIFSVNSAILSSGMFILKSLVEFPYLIFYVGLFIFLQRSQGQTTRRSVNPILLAVITFLCFATVLFVPYFAIGHLNVNEFRIGNLIHVIFLILLMFNIFNLAAYLPSLKILSRFQVKNIIGSFLLIGFLVVLMYKSRNYNYLIADISTGVLHEYRKSMDERFRRLAKDKNGNVIIKAISGGHLIMHYDIGSDPKTWANSCFTDMINKLYGSSIETIIILGKESGANKYLSN